MLSRLMQDFEVGSLVRGGLTTQSDELSIRFFFVPDAASSLDEKGRNIIPSQDFVSQHNVKSVFGIGGPYPQNPANVLVGIFFAQERLERSVLETLKPLFERFMAATGPVVANKSIFT